MVALENKDRSLVLVCEPELKDAGCKDDGRRNREMAESFHSALIRKNALLEERIALLERLAECDNEIKRIDEQLKLF